MQEMELRERAERIFVNALVRTYQRDSLIDWHHTLRNIWYTLIQPCEQQMYAEKLGEAVQQIRSACQKNRQLAQEDMIFLQEIENQLAQLEKQARS